MAMRPCIAATDAPVGRRGRLHTRFAIPRPGKADAQRIEVDG
jgi:hypothetical protein